MKLEDNPVFQKYNGKTIRVERKIFKIQIDGYENEVIVRLIAKYGREDDASSQLGRIYDSSIAHTTYARAVHKCLEIRDEIEAEDIPEIEG